MMGFMTELHCFFKKKCTLFEFQCIQHESINWGHYFYVSYQRWVCHFSWSSELREGPATSSAKGVPSFLSYFKTLSDGPAPGIKPTSLLCGPRADLWPFYGFLCKRFSLYKTVYIKTHKTAINLLLARRPHRRDVTHILSKVSCFLLKPFHFHRLQKRQVFFPYKSLLF